MPQALIEALMKAGKKKGLKKKNLGAFVYGNPVMLKIREKEKLNKESKSKK